MESWKQAQVKEFLWKQPQWKSESKFKKTGRSELVHLLATSSIQFHHAKVK